MIYKTMAEEFDSFKRDVAESGNISEGTKGLMLMGFIAGVMATVVLLKNQHQTLDEILVDLIG